MLSVDRKRIALVLPAYNEENDIHLSFLRIRKGINRFPDYDFSLFPTDDGSTDLTYDEMLRHGERCKLMLFPARNPVNMGMHHTVRSTYERALSHEPDYVLKTDLDSDFDQSVVIENFMPLVSKGADAAVGVRWRAFKEEDNPYEYARRKELARILEERFGLKDLDALSAGSQLYSRRAARKLLDHPVIKDRVGRWRIDMAMPVLARALKFKVPVIKMEKGGYDPNRRPKEKVKEQFDEFTAVIGEVLNVPPAELSKLYGIS